MSRLDIKITNCCYDQNKDNNLDFTRAPKRTYEELMPQVDYKTEYQKPPELEFVAPVRKFYL